MLKSTKASFEEVVSVIESYLGRMPDAADTIDGVANWWLARNKNAYSRDAIQEALDYLVEQGKIDRVIIRNQIIYRRRS